jgi:hypothetical protein
MINKSHFVRITVYDPACGCVGNHKIFRLLNPNVTKVEDTAGPRHQGRCCSRLQQGLDNTGDAVSSAFLKGKQHNKKTFSLRTINGWIL